MQQFDEEDIPEPVTTWLTTFTDLSLLLLSFFILMVSMSTFETERFQNVLDVMRNTFGGSSEGSGPPPSNGGQPDQSSEAMKEFMRLREEMLASQRVAYNDIRNYVAARGLDDKMSASFDDGIITLSVPDSVLFQAGAENLGPEAGAVLRDLFVLFQNQRELDINIKGYTDNSPMPSGARYRDNWELSALRAVNVLRWFVDEGLPVVRLTATGMGDLNPLFPNDTPENRAHNRRVEFTLERKVGRMK